MKRILVTILSILYMISATGATVHIHYCMGKIVSAGFVHKEQGECGKCGMKLSQQKKGCCKDEHKTFKSGDHQFAKVSFEPSGKYFHLPAKAVSYPSYYTHTPAVYRNKTAYANAPPSHWRTCPIYIQVCNFRI